MPFCKSKICQGRWEFAEDDAYCGNCGEKIVDLKIEPAEIALYKSGPGKAKRAVALRNHGQGSIRIIKIFGDREWASFPRADFENKEIRAGEEISLPITIDLDRVAPDEQCSINVETNIGAERLQISILPEPEIEIRIEDLVLQMIEGKSRYESNAVIRVNRGKAVIEKVSAVVDSGGEKLRQIEVKPERELPVIFSAGEELTCRLTIDTTQMPVREEPYDCYLRVKLQDIDAEKEKFFLITITHPPILNVLDQRNLIAPEIRLNIVQEGLWQGALFILKNAGKSFLRINKIDLPGESVRWQEAPSFPIVLETNKTFVAKLTIDGSAYQLGDNQLLFEIRSNCAYRPEYQLKVVLHVTEVQVFQGYIGIDFGTTSSCCSIWDPKKGIMMVTLEKAEILKQIRNITTIPSVIQYLELNHQQPKYIVGQKAYQMSFVPELAPSTVSSIKRKMGSEDKVLVYAQGQQQQFLPEDIVAHIILWLKARIQEFLDGKKPIRAVVTHPSKFSNAQINALKKAFKSAGFKEIITLDEASAAALDYIVREARNKKYTIMVYDFGGGTTDITLIAVDDASRSQNERALSVTTLGITGDRLFGGDDVTERLGQIILEKCVKNLRDKYREAREIEILMKMPEHLDFSDEEVAKTNDNRVQLRQKADSAKINLSEEKEDKIAMLLHARIDGKIRSETFDDIVITRGDLNKAIEDNLRKLINSMRDLVFDANLKRLQQALESRNPDELREWLDPRHVERIAQNDAALLNELKKALQENRRESLKKHVKEKSLEHVDYVLLAGKSSKIPFVKEMMAAVFGEEKIVNPHELKECVSAGACRLGQFHLFPGGNLELHIENFANRTPSRFGILVMTTTLESIFLEFINRFERIPCKRTHDSREVALRRGTNVFSVWENFGLRDYMENNPELEMVDEHVLNIDENISDEELRNAKLSMEIRKDESIVLTAEIAGKEHPFQSKRTVLY